jgi:hypothetical protein
MLKNSQAIENPISNPVIKHSQNAAKLCKHFFVNTSTINLNNAATKGNTALQFVHCHSLKEGGR